MKAVLCVALLVAAVSAISSTDPQVEQFRKFMHRYDKVYNTNEEFDKRFSNFKENLKIIDDLNAKEPLALYGITKFSDLSKEEFRAKYLLPVPHSKPTPSVDMFLPVNTMAAIPTSIDWRTKGAVTAVKNQGDCGSCWAFSTTEEIESQWFLAGHKLIELSEQQIVDCDTTDAGCGGGDTPTAYQYVISAGGLELESQYPYTGEDGTCQANPKDFAAKILGWKYACKGNNETEMAANLVKYGPLSICVDASSWQNYQGGIITSNCGNSLDHCVQVVGYATSSGNVPYWLVRNSWGTDWGENGYLRVERDQNLCGISDEVTIALVDGPSTTGGSGPAATSSSTSSSSSSSSSGAVPGFNGGLF